MIKQLCILSFSFVALLSSLNSLAIEEGDFRIGLQVSNQMHLGVVEVDPQISYGFGLGYLFTENLAFTFDSVYGNLSDDFTHLELNMGILGYFASYHAVYFNAVAGVSYISNQVSDEQRFGGGIFAGAGVDFDVSQFTLVGFQLRYNYIPSPTKATINNEEVGILDSYLSLLFSFSIVI